MRTVLVILMMIHLSGCASTGRLRLVGGAGAGAVLGASGGAILSPNDESRELNALIFGLSGAVVGGALALITDPAPSPPASTATLKERDESLEKTTREFSVRSSQDLPAFLKERLQPIVIEEFVESDSVSEDGTLHEPHKVYRIKQQGELFSKPARNSNGESK